MGQGGGGVCRGDSVQGGGGNWRGGAAQQAADVVLTTYSILENDYRRCVMPAKVACMWVFSEPMLDRLGEWGWVGGGASKGGGQGWGIGRWGHC